MDNPGDYIWGVGVPGGTYHVQIGPNHPGLDALRFWRHWLYTTNQKSLELPPVLLDSRIRLGLTTRQFDRRQSEWDDHGEAYSRTLDGPNLYCTVWIPRGRFRLVLYDMNKDGHWGNDRLRDYEINLFDCSRNERVDELAQDGGKHRVAHCRIRDFWGGVYKAFLVQGPIVLTVELRRNYSLDTILAAVMLDTLEQRPEPYFPRSADLRNSRSLATASPSAGDIAGRYLDSLQQPDQALSCRTTEQRRSYVLLLRYLRASQNAAAKNPALLLRQLAACYFAINDFPHWEDCLRLQGDVAPRTIEKSLRWNPDIPSFSGRERQTILEYQSMKSLNRS